MTSFQDLKDDSFIFYRMWKGRLKRFYQRRTRGWDDSEVWALDYTFCEWIVPRLILLKEKKHGVPGNMFLPLPDGEPWRNHTDEEFSAAEKAWNEIMDKMIHGFGLKLTEWHSDSEWNNEPAEYTLAKQLLQNILMICWD